MFPLYLREGPLSSIFFGIFIFFYSPVLSFNPLILKRFKILREVPGFFLLRHPSHFQVQSASDTSISKLRNTAHTTIIPSALRLILQPRNSISFNCLSVTGRIMI